jgi:hypothetical protein
MSGTSPIGSPVAGLMLVIVLLGVAEGVVAAAPMAGL